MDQTVKRVNSATHARRSPDLLVSMTSSPTCTQVGQPAHKRSFLSYSHIDIPKKPPRPSTQDDGLVRSHDVPGIIAGLITLQLFNRLPSARCRDGHLLCARCPTSLFFPQDAIPLPIRVSSHCQGRVRDKNSIHVSYHCAPDFR